MTYLPHLPEDLPEHPPGWREVVAESRFALEWLRAKRLGDRVLQGLERGDGQSLMLLPGYGADEKAMNSLATRLRQLGYAVSHWGQGKNNGAVHKLLPKLEQKIQDHVQHSGQPITLIGWSLGGYIARELARDLPEHIAGVITLGSPAVGGPKYTITAAAYRKKGFNLDVIESEMAKRDSIPILCPLTVLFSKVDGIVSWPATLDRLTPQARHVEVHSSHIGLVHDAEVFRTIAKVLADQRAKP